ncbi:MAG: hypothetical protein WDA25_01025 [Paracoccaceae bacterium]
MGSGKTTAALVKIVRHARRQRPSPRDGVRRYRHLIIRDTFVNIQRTIFPSWFAIFPKDAGEFVGGPPARHRLQFDDGAGLIELQVDFMGLGDDTIENLLRGYEMTGFYANEVDLLSYGVIDFLFSRTGRFPSAMDGGATWRGGWLDFNAPEQDHWLYQLLVDGVIPESEPEQAAEGFSFHMQPGGMDPNAENRANLPADYYERMLGNMPDWRARRLVHNQWGYSRDGKPVYPEFNDNIHIAKERLEPVRGIPIGIGADAGGTPAATFGQHLPNGQFRILDEVVTGPGTGPKRFADMIMDVVSRRFRQHDLYGWADPSAAYGGDSEGTDHDWLTTVKRATRIHFRPAPTNSPAMRQEAMRTPLSRMIEGRPGVLICPRCRHLRKAFNSGYHYRRIRVNGATGRFDTKPAKNQWSHIAESAEYLALGGPGGLAAVMGAAVRSRPIQVERDYDMFGGAA